MHNKIVERCFGSIVVNGKSAAAHKLSHHMCGANKIYPNELDYYYYCFDNLSSDINTFYRCVFKY